MRKERGYVGILNTLLPLYSPGGSNLGNLVFTGWRGLTKAGLVQRLRWAAATLGGEPAVSHRLLPPLGSELLGPAQRAELGQAEKKEEKLPLFFPHRTTAGSIKSVTGGVKNRKLKKINKRRQRERECE